MKEWFTNARKIAIGSILLVAGVVIQLIFYWGEELGVTQAMLIFTGLISYINVLYSRKDYGNISYIPYVFANVIVTILLYQIFAVTEGPVQGAVLIIAFIVLWVLNSLLVHRESVGRRILVGFLITLFNELFFYIIMFLAAMIPWFIEVYK